MKISTQRDIDPDLVNCVVEFDAADIQAAFDVADPDEDLFFSIFGPGFAKLPVSAQLSLLSVLAELAERAASLDLAAGMPEPKEPI